MVRAGELGYSNGASGDRKDSSSGGVAETKDALCDCGGVAEIIDALSDRGVYGGIERSDIGGRG